MCTFKTDTNQQLSDFTTSQPFPAGIKVAWPLENRAIQTDNAEIISVKMYWAGLGQKKTTDLNEMNDQKQNSWNKNFQI